MTKANGSNSGSPSTLKELAEKYPERFRRLIEAIQSEADNIKGLEKLSNEELADILLKEIWADMDMWTWQSAIVEVVIERLKGKKPK